MRQRCRAQRLRSLTSHATNSSPPGPRSALPSPPAPSVTYHPKHNQWPSDSTQTEVPCPFHTEVRPSKLRVHVPSECPCLDGLYIVTCVSKMETSLEPTVVYRCELKTAELPYSMPVRQRCRKFASRASSLRFYLRAYHPYHPSLVMVFRVPGGGT
jgi:hypothetical protein